MESLSPEIRAKIQEMLDQNQQLSMDVAKLKSALKLKDDHLEEMEEEMERLRSSRDQPKAVDTSALDQLNGQLKHTQDLLDEKTTEMVSLKLQLEATQRSLADAEAAVSELVAPAANLDQSEVCSEPSNSAEFARLTEEVHQLQFALATAKLHEERFNEQLAERQRELLDAAEEIEGMKSSLKVKSEQIVELECEMSRLRADVACAGSGNSMFGEFAEEYQKVKDEMLRLHKEWSLAKKENACLRGELEEAQVLASKREGYTKMGRCVCDEQKTELAKLRLTVEHLERRNHAHTMELGRAADKLKKGEPSAIFRSMLDSLRSQLETSHVSLNKLQAERNLLLDNNVKLKVEASRATSSEKIAKENCQMLEQRISLIKERHRQEIANLDPDAPKKAEAAPPPVSLPAAVVPMTPATSRMGKFAPNETPIRLDPKTPHIQKTPFLSKSMQHFDASFGERSILKTKQQRRLEKEAEEKKINKSAVKKTPAPAGPKFAPIVLKVINGNVVSENDDPENEGIFEKPRLPAGKLIEPTQANRSILANKMTGKTKRNEDADTTAERFDLLDLNMTSMSEANATCRPTKEDDE